MAKRLIICDIDGTLIDQQEVICDTFHRLGDMIARHQIPFTLASGRSYPEVKKFITLLGIRLPILINNGASCVEASKSLWNHYIDPMMLKEAMIKADALDMVIVYGDGLHENVYRMNDYLQNQINKFNRKYRVHQPLASEWPTMKIQKVHITDPKSPGKIDEVLKLLEPYRQALSITRFNDRATDITAKASNKALGAIRLADMLGIDHADIMTIGDAANDIDMIAWGSPGVAVANATDAVKEVADYVCQHHTIAGVIEAIHKFHLETVDEVMTG